MKRIYSLWFLGIIILLTITIGSCGDDDDDDDDDDDQQDGVYDYLYIQEPCGERVVSPGNGVWKKYGFIMADSDGCYNPNMVNCNIHLNVSSNYHITLRFQILSSICDYDVVRIIGEDNSKGYCGSSPPAYSLYTTSSWLMIQFDTGSALTSSSDCFTGFKLYYTAYHTGECSDDEFRCAIDGRCIPSELKCDKYDNCGDWSDETAGACGLSQGAIIAISVTSAMVGLSVLAFICYCIYDRATRHKATGARENATRRRPPAVPTENPVESIVLPEYPEPPPLYTVVNTVYAGVYEEQCEDDDAPPSYQSVGAGTEITAT